MKKIVFFLFIYCFVVVFLSSGLSPIINQLYSDSGVYVHYGRVLFDGGLPYVGFLEYSNKGLNTYFINALGYLITPSSRTGICVLEALSKSVDLFFIFLTLNLYIPKKKSLMGTLMMFVIMMSRFTYIFGNQIEQWQFTSFVISFYFLSKYNKDLKEGNKHNPLYMFAHGLCFSYAFNWKMNYVLFYAPVAIVIIGFLLYKKEYKNALYNIFYGGAGVILGLLPYFVYLYKNELFVQTYSALFLSLINNYGRPMSISSILEFIFQPKTVWLLPFFIYSFYLVYKSIDIHKAVKYLYFLAFACSFLACTMSGYSFAIYHYHLYIYLIPVFISLGNKISFRRYYIAITFIVTICLNLNLIFVYVVPNEYKSTPFKCMNVLKEFEELTEQNVDLTNARIISLEPRYYSILNISNQSVKYYYDTSTKQGVDNIKDLITNGQVDVIFGSYQQFSTPDIKNIIDDQFVCLKRDDYTGWVLYLKKQF